MWDAPCLKLKAVKRSTTLHVPAPDMIPGQPSDAGDTLYGTGFNAHNQLKTETTGKLHSFEAIYQAKNSNCRVLFAEWSTAVLIDGNHLFSLGFQKIDQDLEDANRDFVSAIGDHDGLRACIDAEGRLYVVEGEIGTRQTLVCKTIADESPRIGRLARASNGRIAMIAKQAPNGNLCHLTEFESFETFLRWFSDPVGDGNYPIGHHMLPGRPKSLLANTATFVLLMESGGVWTWGDSRYRSLGRSVSGKGATESSVPEEVEALGGLKINSISAGGWQAAALSEEGSLYIWGAMSPGTDDCLEFLEPDAMCLVNIPIDKNGEPPDVLGVNIGSDHIAVVAEDRKLYVAGSNSSGQLGIDKNGEFLKDFQPVGTLAEVRNVVCGPNYTLVWVADSQTV